MIKYTVLLDDQTVGEICFSTSQNLVGEVIEVKLHDQNGLPIEKKGKVIEILNKENV